MSEFNLDVGVLDYGCGNLESISDMIRYLGAEPRVVTEVAELANLDRLILPGVGNFGVASRFFESRKGYRERLADLLSKQNFRLLGICLGMQLLAESSEESPGRGLSLLDARSTLMRSDDPNKAKVPHIGWKEVDVASPSTLFPTDSDKAGPFYFSHSYILENSEPSETTAFCHHGGHYVSAIQKGNIFGVQFHPEKSNSQGAAVLRNFLWGSDVTR